MDRAFDVFLDILILVFAMITGFSITMYGINEMNNTSWVSLHDKTVLKQGTNITPEKITLTGADVLLMLTVQDHSAPYPAAISINNREAVTFNAEWFNSLSDNLNHELASGLASEISKEVKDITVKQTINGRYVWGIDYV